MIVGFAGPRFNEILKLPGHDEELYRKWFFNAAKVALQPLNVESVLSCMNLGVEQWAAEFCISNEIPFTAALPFQEMGEIWTDFRRREYEKLLSQATNVIHVCKPGYQPHKIVIAQQWMVRKAQHLVIFWDEKAHGVAADCFRYAQKMGRGITILNPLYRTIKTLSSRVEALPE